MRAWNALILLLFPRSVCDQLVSFVINDSIITIANDLTVVLNTQDALWMRTQILQIWPPDTCVLCPNRTLIDVSASMYVWYMDGIVSRRFNIQHNNTKYLANGNKPRVPSWRNYFEKEVATPGACHECWCRLRTSQTRDGFVCLWGDNQQLETVSTSWLQLRRSDCKFHNLHILTLLSSIH